jgi:hypothetical protein
VQDSIPPQKVNTERDVYCVQIFAIGRLLPANAPEFKGYTNIRHTKFSDLYRYTTGTFYSREEAQAYRNKVLKDFPQAFVVKQ